MVLIAFNSHLVEQYSLSSECGEVIPWLHSVLPTPISNQKERFLFLAPYKTADRAALGPRNGSVWLPASKKHAEYEMTMFLLPRVQPRRGRLRPEQMSPKPRQNS